MDPGESLSKLSKGKLLETGCDFPYVCSDSAKESSRFTICRNGHRVQVVFNEGCPLD